LPFLLVHGLVISSLYMVPLGECLAEHVPVHAVDLPGFGLTDGPAKAPSVVAMADALVQWMDAADLPVCHIVGNSLGCEVATCLAARYPQRVGCLILIGPTMGPDHHRFWDQFGRIAWDIPHEPWTLIFNHVVDHWRAGLRRAFGMIRHMLRYDMEADLRHIKGPTLVLRGACDPIVIDPWIREAAAMLEKGEAHTMDVGWHCVHYSHPHRVAETIFAFVHRARESAASLSVYDRAG
jgi:pimeloyl-ACP methyl ester carboxylesterase